MTTTVPLPKLPFAVFDEFGQGADDRMLAYGDAREVAARAEMQAKLEKAEKDAARYQRLLKDVEAVLAEMIKRLQDGEAMQGRVFVSLGITANRTLASIQAAIKGDSHEN